MPEIVSRLQRMYSRHLSRTAIYRALDELGEDGAVKTLVRPIDPMASELKYKAEGARWIARKVIRGRLPAKIAPRALPPAQVPKMLPVAQVGTRTGLE